MSASRFLNWTRAARSAASGLSIRVAGRDVSVAVSVYGPGDVGSLAPGEIRFREPAPGAVGMPPNLFPYVEFRQPDFPWQVTPTPADAHGQLAPWLTLIVVEAPSGTPLGKSGKGNLPVVTATADNLPPIGELALWTHTQIPSEGAQNDDAIRRGFSRIISPRALAPVQRYLACLVPTYEAGRLAGLGEDPPDKLSSAPAWTDATTSVQLPVYDSWFFTTAASGDFETLARKLKGRDIAAGSRALRLNVSAVSGPGTIAPLEGALIPRNGSEDWTGPPRTAAATRIGDWLKREAVSGTPVIGPPIYGSIETGQTQVATGWMRDLNLDPRRRAAAGLGVAIVRDHQEELVDEAWRQAGDLERARKEHSGALLADVAHLRLHTRLHAPLSGPQALLALAPALPLMKEAANAPVRTTAARMASSAVPSSTITAPFRRLLRTKRPRAALTATLPIQNARVISPGAPPPTPARLVTKQQLQVALTPVGSHPPPFRFGGILNLSESQLALLKNTDAVWQARKIPVVQVTRPAQFAWVHPLPPAVTASIRLNARLELGGSGRVRGGSGIVATPHFPQALSAWLDPAYLMAGVQIPPDTAGLLEVNAPFIEALLVGANHELSRELLWRGVPLDRSATLLTRFFAAAPPSNPIDIPSVSSWTAADALGSHTTAGQSSVLVLRTRLVSRLSEALVYLAHAEMDGHFRRPGSQQVLPSFQGTAGLDTAYFGFAIPPGQLAGSTNDPGWYLVIQEKEGAPKFGLDETAPDAFNTWNDLAWPLVATSHNYVAVSAKKPAPANPGQLHWGAGSAQMAAICLQKPIRVSIHASTLIAQS